MGLGRLNPAPKKVRTNRMVRVWKRLIVTTSTLKSRAAVRNGPLSILNLIFRPDKCQPAYSLLKELRKVLGAERRA